MKQGKHLLHFGLLLSFITLAATGVFAYILPFSLITTRIHIVFALFTLVLVGYHLYQRYQYFFNTLCKLKKNTVKALLLLCLLWLFFFISSTNNLFLPKYLMQNSYEGTHQKLILRSSPHSATHLFENGFKTIRATSSDSNDKLQDNQTAIAIEVRFPEKTSKKPAIAIWAESSTGAIIETLYLSPELAYSDQPNWYGIKSPRHHILPIWRNKFTLISGIEPNGDIDIFSGATAEHKFNLNKFFINTEDDYLIFLEINMPFDTNEHWQDKNLGQPSILYSAYVEHSKKRGNFLLELTGHGGNPENKGKIQYILDTLTSAKELIDVALISTFSVKQ